jgi:hypothetical protein
LPSMNGYSSNPASCVNRRIADGSRRTLASTRAT